MSGPRWGSTAWPQRRLRPDLPVHAFEARPLRLPRACACVSQVNAFANIVEHRTAPLGVFQAGHDAVAAASRESDFVGGVALGVGDAEQNVERAVALPSFRFSTAWASALTATARPWSASTWRGRKPPVILGRKIFLTAKPDIILETFRPKACAAINAATAPLGYKVFHIDEDTGTLTPQDGSLRAAGNHASPNQFLTTRPSRLERFLCRPQG